MKLSNLILPGIVLIVVGMIYFFYFAPTDQLGSFGNFSPGSEINQEINVLIVKDKKTGRTNGGKITSFFAKDKNNKIVEVFLNEPADPSILDAEIVELMGHMHGNTFTARRISVIQ